METPDPVRVRRPWLVCAAALAWTASAPAQRAAPGTVVDGELGAALDAAVAAAEPPFWGAVSVATGGRTALAKGYGLQDRQKVPNGPHSLFDLGGFTAVLTSALALQLVEARKLHLDEPVGRHFGDWPADKQGITVRHLLAYTSGLPDNADWSEGGAGSTAAAVAAIGRTTLLAPPGAAVHDTRLNAILLALLIDEVAGGYEKALQRHVLRPARMPHAAYSDDRRIDRRLVTERLAAAHGIREPATDHSMNWAHRGAYGMLASVLDLHAFASALHAGRLLDDLALGTLWRPADRGDEFRIRRVAHGGLEFVQARGAVAGYRTRLLTHRETDTIVVVLTDERELDALEGALVGTLVEAVARPEEAPPEGAAVPEPAGVPPQGAGPEPSGPEPSQPAGPRAAPELLARFVGVFAAPTGGSFEVRAEDGRLRVTGRGLQPSARLLWGGWPPPGREDRLRKAEDRGMALLQRFVDGAPAGFASDAAAVAARALLDGLRERLGPAPKLSFVGTEPRQPMVSWFRLSGREDVELAATWAGDDRFAKLRAPAAGAPFSAVFAVERPDWAVARVGTVLVSLSVEGRGAARVLVYQDGTDLLECPWQGR